MHIRLLLDQTPSYEKNSNGTVLMLKCLNELEVNIFLFTSDATVMCPNIDTEEGLTFLTSELDNLIFKVEHNCPIREIITAIKPLLIFNVLQFGDACYRQKGVQSIRSPFSCLWAILTCSTMEMLALRPRHKKNIAVFKRFTDNIVTIWKEQG